MKRNNSRSSNGNGQYLEPRVAQLEVGMERLTDDVRTLANVVREQGAQMESEVQKLIVAVTQAAGPRKTDWGTLIAAVMMIMAIGTAVLIPLNQTAQENKDAIITMESKMDSHSMLQSHPVGLALVNRLEEHVENLKNKHEEDILQQDKNAKEAHDTIRTHFHEEVELITRQYQTSLSALEAKVNLHNDRLYARVVKVEDVIEHQKNSDLNELRLWRIRAMNGDIQSKSPISSDIIFDPHIPQKPEQTSPTPK